MRKNLTISLLPEDWRLVQTHAKSMNMAFSALFHRLIHQSLGAPQENPKKIAKYRPLFKPHADFLAQRAETFAKARFNPSKPA